MEIQGYIVQLDQWIDRYNSHHAGLYFDLGYRIERRGFVILRRYPGEKRGDGAEQELFLKATLKQSTGAWSVFWMRADDKWFPYTSTKDFISLKQILAEFTKDPYGCFSE